MGAGVVAGLLSVPSIMGCGGRGVVDDGAVVAVTAVVAAVASATSSASMAKNGLSSFEEEEVSASSAMDDAWSEFV